MGQIGVCRKVRKDTAVKANSISKVHRPESKTGMCSARHDGGRGWWRGMIRNKIQKLGHGWIMEGLGNARWKKCELYSKGERKSLRDMRQTDRQIQQDFDSYSASQIWPGIRMTRIACYKSCYQGSTPRPFQSAFPGMWPRNYTLKWSFQVIPGHPAWHWFMKRSLGITALLTNAFLKSCLFMEILPVESLVQSARQACYLEATFSNSLSLGCFNKTHPQFEFKTPEDLR